MPLYCCVPFCNSSQNRDKIAFHQFPSDFNMRILWRKAIARKDPSNNTLWEPSQYSVVCQKHFQKNDYCQGVKNLILRRNVIPSIFPGYPDYLQPKNRASLQVSFKGKGKDMLVESSNVQNSLENDKNEHCEPITVSSSVSKAATKSTSVQLSDISESCESDINMQYDPLPVQCSSDFNLSIPYLEKQNEALKRKNKILISNLNKARKKIKKIKELNKSLLKKNAYLEQLNAEFSDIEKAATEGSKHAMFIMDKVRSHKNN